MRHAGLVLLLLLTSCVTTRAVSVDRVKVSGLDLVFTSPGEGLLSVDVPINAIAPTHVEWRVLLDGHPFAAGVDENLTFTNGVLSLRAPLSWRHLTWREGSRTLAVSVRGEASWKTRPEVVSFEGQKEVLVPGAPHFDARGEP
jgi:hypothetical protein